ncbi:hypothetical protein NW754_010851 [Fusarium falciforme]|nr:hypothetical protein NW754_010851 [Fusarium falciforme]
MLVLNKFDKLKHFTPKRPDDKYSITLASRKKLFSQTHYRKMKFPKQPHEILRSFGAEFSYYDEASGFWENELPETPWFQHLLGPWLPEGVPDPYENCDQSKEEVYHPTSSDIIANEIDCPQDMPIHEFSAYQRLVSGRGRRWLAMLIELSSSNINFSSEITTTLFTRLALQAGPAILEGFKEKALDLLVRIRHITSNWIVQLRNEVRVTPEGETARKSSDYAFRAALLCRQTFSIYADSQGPHAALSSEDVQCFFRASIALQEHLLLSVGELSPALKHLLVQDLYTSYRMRVMTKGWVQKSPHCLENAINETWSDAGFEKRAYSSWTFISSKAYSWWATARVEGTKWTAPQVIHYHMIQGHLTVDGKPLGRLPLEMREDEAIKELFGGQHLLTRPSNLLEHQLVNEVEGHQIHFGSKNGKVVIRAIFRGSLLEHVPRTVFKGILGYDLPSGLVDDCVHWLNLQTGKVEMRRKPRIWVPKPSNWILDVHNRQAVRGVGRRTKHGPSLGTYLVEPRSEVGQRIYHIFQGFEDAEKLTIYQPSGAGSLSVEMKRLEIRFSVNFKGLLQCQQLRAEIDPQQDVGALYGLCSQIQLRGIANPDSKSVLVPIGNIRWERRGIHVAVNIANDGLYAKFTVDQLLGRLDCPPEPLLLYLKAALHALTSFPLPDGLTGRTGTEEARHCLIAVRSQPWAPLQRSSQELLSVIRSLSPKRWLYPPGLGIYQKVKWDSRLTMTIQHEGLAPLVDSIALRSKDLETFAPTPETEDEFEFGCDDPAIRSLYLRGRIRRQIYERPTYEDWLEDTPEKETPEEETPDEEDLKSIADQYYAMQAEEATRIASLIVHEGPGLHLSKGEFERLVQELSIERIYLEIAWENLQPELQRLSYNLELSVYLLQVDEAIKEIRQRQSPAISEKQNEIWNSKPATLTSLKPTHSNGVFKVPHLASSLMKKDIHFNHATKGQATMDQLSRSFANRNLRKDDKAPKTFSLVPQEMTTLSRIFKRFTASPETTRQQYGNDLEASLEALIHDRKVNKKPKRMPFAGELSQAIAQSLEVLHDHVSAIRASLSDGEAGFQWLDAGNLWPCLSPVMLLEQLRHSNQSHSSPKMQNELLLYGVLFTKLQRLVRMRDAELWRDEKRSREEQEHEGHSNWSPLEHPEWLLLEIDNNILINVFPLA